MCPPICSRRNYGFIFHDKYIHIKEQVYNYVSLCNVQIINLLLNFDHVPFISPSIYCACGDFQKQDLILIKIFAGSIPSQTSPEKSIPKRVE